MSFSFDSSSVQNELIPQGRYDFIVSNAEERESKSGHFMLCFEFMISDGEYAGKKLFENFLVNHPTAGEFSRRSLKQLSVACLLPKWDDASELKGKSFSAEISHKEDTQGVIKERVVKYKKIQQQSVEYKVLDVKDIPF